ncbi:MAG: hypothetical protein ACREMD_01315 [Gemmatimonadota bacterium]
MTLGRFAIAVGAEPKWVLNAGALLGHAIPYSVEEARGLGLAKWIHDELGVTLKRAHRMAAEILEQPLPPAGPGPAQPLAPSASLEFADGGLTIVVDLERYLSDFAVRLSRARTHYAPRRRGRPPDKPGSRAAERALEHGIDVDLVRANMRLTPAERLRRLDRDREFVEKLKGRALRASRSTSHGGGS